MALHFAIVYNVLYKKKYIILYLFLARHLWHRCKYCRHWMYMKTTPPVKPTVTTTSFVQNGHPMRPRLTSSAARSIRTHSDHMTHKAAAQWNSTAQNRRRLSTPDISKLRHWNSNENKNVQIKKIKIYI